jgi:hypothetical protein
LRSAEVTFAGKIEGGTFSNTTNPFDYAKTITSVDKNVPHVGIFVLCINEKGKTSSNDPVSQPPCIHLFAMHCFWVSGLPSKVPNVRLWRKTRTHWWRWICDRHRFAPNLR